MSAPTVLVVDDEPRMLSMIELALDAAGYDVLTASDAADAWRILSDQPVSVAILDVMLPGTSGIELCRRIREQSAVPVILLTALGSTAERVAGLEAGADDYVSKPFSPRELVLRVGAILRRTSSRTPRPLAPTRRVVGDLTLDAALGLVLKRDRDLHVTPAEFRLLWLLAETPGECVLADRLVDVIGHGQDRWGGRAALRTAIYRLRTRIEDSGEQARILNEHGRGYRLVTRGVHR